MKTKLMLPVIASWLLALLFILAGVSKVMDPGDFAETMDRYRLLPWGLSAALALYLPWLELVVAGALLLPAFRRPAILLSALLFAVFSLAIASALLRGLDIRCGCFGSADANTPLWISFIRSLALASACSWLLVTQESTPPRS